MDMIVNKVRSLPFPPVKNIFNVAMQTARQNMPEKPNKQHYTEPTVSQFANSKAQNVHFSDDVHSTETPPKSHHELNPFSTLNPFDQANDADNGRDQACTSFMGDYEQGYQRSENYLNR